MKTYKETNGTSYDVNTSQEVINVLEKCRLNNTRIRVFYGDVETGRCWNEVHDVEGYIRRSTGKIKIPILVYNTRSFGGGGLLDSRIIKISTTNGKKILYQNENFHDPEIVIKENLYITTEKTYTHELYVDGVLFGRHENLECAKKLEKKLL